MAKENTEKQTFFPPKFYPGPEHYYEDIELKFKHHHPELFRLLMDVSTVEMVLAKRYSRIAGTTEKWLARVLIVSLWQLYGLARPATGPGIIAAICAADHADDLTEAGVAVLESRKPACPPTTQGLYDSLGVSPPSPQSLIDLCAMCIAFPVNGPYTAWWQEKDAVFMADWLVRQGVGDDPLMALRRLIHEGVILTPEGRGMLADLTKVARGDGVVAEMPKKATHEAKPATGGTDASTGTKMPPARGDANTWRDATVFISDNLMVVKHPAGGQKRGTLDALELNGNEWGALLALAKSGKSSIPSEGFNQPSLLASRLNKKLNMRFKMTGQLIQFRKGSFRCLPNIKEGSPPEHKTQGGREFKEAIHSPQIEQQHDDEEKESYAPTSDRDWTPRGDKPEDVFLWFKQFKEFIREYGKKNADYPLEIERFEVWCEQRKMDAQSHYRRVVKPGSDADNLELYKHGVFTELPPNYNGAEGSDTEAFPRFKSAKKK